MDGDIYVEAWFPDGVQHIITTGGSHYIGSINDSTVLKYPHIKGTGCEALDVEAQILEHLGKHHRIIAFKGRHKDGLLLEYAPNGTLERHLQQVDLPVKERIRLARETAEGVVYVHKKNVLICDINVRNVLLDAEFHVKLCDFQGRLLSPNGEVLVSGGASENAESYKPRCDKDYADTKTDIFALGSTIYFIMTGHRPYPEYDTIDDEAIFEELYRKAKFPLLNASLGGNVVQNCWTGKYQSAEEAVSDLLLLEHAM
ncbi:hypothetical protein ONS95_005894 [Cadophora gregata]|uniref:uncharacterized protein n=1 Tax=Cadophora gregata TaxID=51156 RepID=UPI0026DD202D|nr:uncharacterized protein ONS95_005894 [Cadophora gregata]KAK0102272.1 hypothetical protein ONS95_005894 [Cadophora gregata]KAK0103899.1 hypothetical protein ONS96_005007 [Cadophora gregata f. sp. sojae]